VRRAIAIAIGLVLIVVAFIAAANVADTREGLIAEIVTLLAGLAGVGVLLYGLVPRRPASQQVPAAAPARPVAPASRTANDLVVGGAGLFIAAVLLGGLLVSAGWQWALVGAVLLLPMVAGSAYMLVMFARAPQREWRIDLRRLTSSR
jgi:hypothetical protein